MSRDIALTVCSALGRLLSALSEQCSCQETIALTICSALGSYRGYGLSEGSPSERGLQQDSQAALDYLLRRPDVHPRRVGAKPQPTHFACAHCKACCRAFRLHSLLCKLLCDAAAIYWCGRSSMLECGCL